MKNTNFINEILDKINQAAEKGTGLELSAAEAKELSESVGDLCFIPHYTADEVLQLHKEGKLGQKKN